MQSYALPFNRYVRKEIGQRVRLRLTPEIRFEYDDYIDEMEMVGAWGLPTTPFVWCI